MTTTISNGALVATRTRRRWPLAVAVVALVGVGGGSWAVAAHPDSGTRTERLDLRDPAVLREAHTRVQIAEWASDHHLSGLSPASLTPLPDRS